MESRSVLKTRQKKLIEAIIRRHKILRSYKAEVDPGPNHDKYIYVYIY